MQIEGEKIAREATFLYFQREAVKVQILNFRMAEEGGGKDGKKGDVSVCRDFLRNVCTRGDRWDLLQTI